MEDGSVLTNEKEATTNEVLFFKRFFRFFMVGQILLMISIFGNATIINGVPQYVGLLLVFEYVAYALYFIFLVKAKNTNESFKKCYMSFVIYLVISLLVEFGENSTSRFVTVVVKGLDFSIFFIRGIFYLYFFHGCYLFFRDHNYVTGTKRAKAYLIAFLVIYSLWVILDQLSGMRLLLVNYFFNRFFMFGKWAMLLILYAFMFAVVLGASRYLSIKTKKEKTQNEAE